MKNLNQNVQPSASKCQKYKIFQDNYKYGNKRKIYEKYQHGDNKQCESLHCISLYLGDISNQHKGNEMASEPEPKLSEDQQDTIETKEVKDPRTATFRDGKRRIDVVLVVQSDNGETSRIDDVKLNYLVNIIRVGLEIEIEPGTMSKHKHLVFINIHAPDTVLEEYGNYFGVKRYFKDIRVEFITPNQTLFGKCFPFVKSKHEKEWIKLARQSYHESLFYSNAERSLITYKILLQLPFGDHQNDFTLNRLLESNIILDVFALHDGPYFFVPDQDMSKTNARQILFYNWIGLRNVLKIHPLNLIHEYFGPRVGFYFAFYNFYNQWLALAAAAGVLTIFFEVFDTTDDVLREKTCNDRDTAVCPECADINICPFRNLSDYCWTITLNNILDNPFTVYFAIFIVVWAILFVLYWKRKETYWNWMWELDRHNAISKTAIRSEYRFNYKLAKISEKTGIAKYYDSGIRLLFRFLVTKCIIAVCIIGILTFIMISIISKDELRSKFSHKFSKRWGDYIVLAIFQTGYIIVIVILEKICHMISYYLVKYENHKAYQSYEKSLVIKLFGVSFALTFPLLIYLSMVKGLFFLCPGYILLPVYIKTPLLDTSIPSIFSENCGPFSCINELCIMLLMAIFMKQILFRVTAFIFKIKSDYNQKNISTATVPCWEREYMLKPITEKLIQNKYNFLALQFGLVTLFVTAFPLAPFLAFIVNVWDIRYTARLWLLGSRRPLLLRRSGIGAWKNIFIFLSCAAILFNPIVIVRCTRTIPRYIYMQDHDTMDDYLSNTLSTFITKNYYNMNHSIVTMGRGFNMPDKCLYPAYIRERTPLVKTYNVKPGWRLLLHHYKSFEMLIPEGVRVKFYECMFFFLFEHLMILTLIILANIIPAHDDLKQTVSIEKRIKDEHVHSVNNQDKN